MKKGPLQKALALSLALMLSVGAVPAVASAGLTDGGVPPDTMKLVRSVVHTATSAAATTVPPEIRINVPEAPPVPLAQDIIDETEKRVHDVLSKAPRVESPELPGVTLPAPLPPVEPLDPPQQDDDDTTDDTPDTDTPDTDGGDDDVDGNIFDTGAVSLRFDDGWLSQYENALPLLNQYDLDGTFYITSRQNAEYGFSGFMSRAQIEEMHAAGHEIGAHTRTHADLLSLDAEGQREEIAGSKQDLQDWGLGPISTFAYPFNSYDEEVMEIVKDIGFSGAVTTLEGPAAASTDRYQLPHVRVDGERSPAEVIAEIDAAMENRQWAILGFHQTAAAGQAFDGEEFNTTPEDLAVILQYLADNNIPVVTVSEGIQSFE